MQGKDAWLRKKMEVNREGWFREKKVRERMRKGR
jgi:hypothetical protein